MVLFFKRSSQSGADTDTTLSEIIGNVSNKSVVLSSEYDSSENDTGIRNYAADDRWKEDSPQRTARNPGDESASPKQHDKAKDFFADNTDDDDW